LPVRAIRGRARLSGKPDTPRLLFFLFVGEHCSPTPPACLPFRGGGGGHPRGALRHLPQRGRLRRRGVRIACVQVTTSRPVRLLHPNHIAARVRSGITPARGPDDPASSVDPALFILRFPPNFEKAQPPYRALGLRMDPI